MTIASPSVKKLLTVRHDFIEGMETFEEKPAYRLQSHAAFADVNASQYDGLIIPGGRAPEYIRMNKALPDIIRHFFEAGKPVGAICHAAQVLAVLPELMHGREYTAYPHCQPDVTACGATYINQALHTHRNLVSGQAWPDLHGAAYKRNNERVRMSSSSGTDGKKTPLEEEQKAKLVDGTLSPINIAMNAV